MTFDGSYEVIVKLELGTAGSCQETKCCLKRKRVTIILQKF